MKLVTALFVMAIGLSGFSVAFGCSSDTCLSRLSSENQNSDVVLDVTSHLHKYLENWLSVDDLRICSEAVTYSDNNDTQPEQRAVATVH